MSDQTTSIDALRQLVAQFVAERDWQKFHSPKNLAMALAIEAAELMEHFQWITPAASRTICQERDRKTAVAEEMADVLCYLLALADELDIDLDESLRQKMVKNAAKYPVEEYRGRYGPEDEGN